MYLTVKQQLKHLSKSDYQNLRELCHTAKNLMNEALYINRQYFFAEHKYLGYMKTYSALKLSENYKILNSNNAQQCLKVVDNMFASFFALLKLGKNKQYDSKSVRMPYYLPKDGFAPLVIQKFKIHNGVFTLPYSRSYAAEHEKILIKVPPILEGRRIKFVKIIPMNNAKFFEIQYIYEAEESQGELDKTRALAIDLGLNNLMTCASSEGNSFIIDGRKLKAVNQWYNKENSRLCSIKDKQKHGKKPTFRQNEFARKRKNRVNDYISKSCRKVINYCVLHNIGILVCGYNAKFQQDSNMGRVNNQNFVNIPYGRIRHKLEYLCRLHGIEYHEQEESYTSKASFLDCDEIPIYNADNTQKYIFSGRRIHRGLYQSKNGIKINADVNGALNILRKSNVVSLTRLNSRGGLATPLRIRII